MKAKSLQFGKAMSAALLVLLLSVAGMKNALAQTQVATLQHGDDVSAFYGATAFVDAHTAAVDGDIVTLSSGIFTSASITKAITLRGAGVVEDTVNQTVPTVITGTVTINVANDSIPFQMEGIMFSTGIKFTNLINPKFTRCSFNSIARQSSSNCLMRNAQFVNCMITTFDFSSAVNTTLINSAVWNPNNMSSSCTVLLYNSVFGQANCSYTYTNKIGGVSAFNSVLVRNNSFYYSCHSFGESCVFINCIGILSTGGASAFGSAYTFGCTSYNSFDAVFETFNGTFSLEETFILKEEIATGFLGNDGTEVGIHGGLMPYSNRPSYMVLKRCNVAPRSTIDGKLSVDIEVVTEGE